MRKGWVSTPRYAVAEHPCEAQRPSRGSRPGVRLTILNLVELDDGELLSERGEEVLGLLACKCSKSVCIHSVI